MKFVSSQIIRRGKYVVDRRFLLEASKSMVAGVINYSELIATVFTLGP